MSKKQSGIPRLDICTLSDTKDDLMISRLTDYLEEHQNLVFPHRHSFYHLVFFTKGKGSHTIDFQRFVVKPYQIYFMAPGQVHSWDFEGEMQGYVVNFSGTFFQSFLLRPEYLESFTFLTGTTTDGVIDLDDKYGLKVKNLFECIIEQSVAVEVMHVDMIRVLLLQVFITLEQSYHHTKPYIQRNTQNVIIRNFNKLVEKHFSELKLPGGYAELLNVTPNHLNALVKENLGKQAGEVIRDRILLEAKRLLVNKELTVSEIAYKLNFNDNSYFTRFFRKYGGITPEAFRQNSINNQNV
jgi:AraC family transcriptional activator of pobA